MLRRVLWFVPILSILAISACGGGDDEPAAPTAPSTPPPTGPATLQLTDLTVGTGIEPVAGSFATFHYTVWLYDPAGTDSKGTRIQSSRDSGVPSTFRLGTNATIVGFEQAVSTMKVGGIRRAIIPPSLAYGTTGNSDGSIPPNSWIVFEIELLVVT